MFLFLLILFSEPIQAFEVTNNTTQELISRVALAYGNNPELAIAIADCEAKVSQSAIHTNKDKWHSKDVGLFQINDHYNGSLAKKLNLDIYNKRDNIVFAMWLLKTQGVAPWKASKTCWSKKISV